MRVVKIETGSHEWEKTNLVTLRDSRGHFYDQFKCKRCGIQGKLYMAGILNIPNKYDKKIKRCPGLIPKTFLKVTHCNAVGNQFENLTDGSIHPIIPPPEGRDNRRGEWVMGIGEPVLLLYGEFKYHEDL